MVSLHISPKESPGNTFEVWPKAEKIPAGLVSEARDYFFELRDLDDPFAAELFVDDIKLEALRPKDRTTAVWTWSPGFHAGTVECKLLLHNRNVFFNVVTDADARKLSRQEYDQLLQEILEDTTALFSLTSFRKSFSQSHQSQPPPIARLQYLNDKLDDIEAVIREINSRPQRILSRETVLRSAHQVKRVTGNEILGSFRKSRVQKVSNTQVKLPANLRGLLPIKIEQRISSYVLDIREHREIKSTLIKWRAWIINASAKLESSLSSKSLNIDKDGCDSYRNWARKCKGMERRLSKLLKLPLFDSIPESNSLPRSSPTYQKIPAYRKFFKLYRDFNVGISNVFGDFLNIPLSRTFDLYEIWCFLRLLRASVNKWGADNNELRAVFEPSSDKYSITVKAGSIVVPLKNGTSLAFQRTFREYWLEDGNLGSFTRTMIPDISFFLSNSDDIDNLIVLDSKYRINSNINDAISSIHTYRDAIVKEGSSGVSKAVTGAYLISPHQPGATETWKDTKPPGRFFHPDYRGEFKFGAVTMRPGMHALDVEKIIDGILSSEIGNLSTNATNN